ncbi:MAG TPA: hypothetical protein VF584_17315 [Longimicrobium sp.]
MLAPGATLAHFARMLDAAGFDRNRPDPSIAWRVFREFAAVPVSAADDTLLFQCGTYDFTGREQFHWNLTRQFSIEEDGEHAGMEQLQLTVLYEPASELRPLEVSLWSSDCGSLEEFFAEVEALPGFSAPGAHPPTGSELFYEQV